MIRPLAEVYKAIGKAMHNDMYLNFSEEEFVGFVMANSHGYGEPKKIREIYYKLMVEAGKVNYD